MIPQHPTDERLAECWRDREQLGLDGWTELYGLSRQACLPANAGAQDGQRFDLFFIRRIAESTPSALRSAGQLQVLFNWFCRAGASGGMADGEAGSNAAPPPPSLLEVEESLFRPADALCLELAAAVEHASADEEDEPDADLDERVAELRTTVTRNPSAATGAMVPPPQWVTDYLARKVRARTSVTATAMATGQLVRVDRLIGPDSDVVEQMARPLLVLLDSPTSVPEVWWGWMAGSESAYAGEWDALIEADDIGVDPMAATVQLWNPIRVYCGTVAAVVGRLSEKRHAAVRSLAAHFLAGESPAPFDLSTTGDLESPVVHRVTRAGLTLATGRALGALDDPRWAYQRLYRVVNEVLGAPAGQAEAAWEEAQWLVTATVEQIGPARFVASAADSSGRELEIDFKQPGVQQPLLLIQTCGDQRFDGPINMGEHRIEFVGGLATPGAELLPDLTQVLGLPPVFAGWSDVMADFQRQKRTTSSAMRMAIQGLLAAAQRIKVTPSEVMAFLFPQLSNATRAQRGGESLPVVYAVGQDDQGRTELGLCWIGQEPVNISAVELAFLPNGPIPARDVQWIQARRVVLVEGKPVAADSFAAARFNDGVLHIELWGSVAIGQP